MFSNDLPVYFLLVFFAVKITMNTNIYCIFPIHDIVYFNKSFGRVIEKKNLTRPVIRQQRYFFDQPKMCLSLTIITLKFLMLCSYCTSSWLLSQGHRLN